MLLFALVLVAGKSRWRLPSGTHGPPSLSSFVQSLRFGAKVSKKQQQSYKCPAQGAIIGAGVGKLAGSRVPREFKTRILIFQEWSDSQKGKAAPSRHHYYAPNTRIIPSSLFFLPQSAMSRASSLAAWINHQSKKQGEGGTLSERARSDVSQHRGSERASASTESSWNAHIALCRFLASVRTGVLAGWEIAGGGRANIYFLLCIVFEPSSIGFCQTVPASAAPSQTS